MSYKICIWMIAPSHWRSCFFEALFAHSDIDLQVRYFERISEGGSSEDAAHSYEQFLDTEMSSEEMVQTLNDGKERIHLISSIFNPRLVDYFCTHGFKWCHWGEEQEARLEELVGRKFPLCQLFRPIISGLKKREGRDVVSQAFGVLAQGVFAEGKFVKMGVPRSRISKLFCCANPLSRKPPSEKIEAFANGRRVFLAVGKLSRRKGIDLLLKAFAELRTDEWCLVLCGQDDSSGVLKSLAEKLGVADKVLFFGAYPFGRISSVYAAADVFILASRVYEWGIVLNEAASLGLPLVSSDSCGAAWHQIKVGANGFRVKSGSVKSLYHAMCRFVEDPGLIEQYGEFSKALYYNEFTPERNAQRLIDALDMWEGARDAAPPVRVIVQQPALPQYRVPFFRAIMNQAGVRVKLLYSSVDPSLANAPAPDLDAEFVPMKIWKVFGVSFMWHSAQLQGARRGACDVLVLSWNTQYLSLVPAIIRARLNRIRVVLWGHGYSKNESILRKNVRNLVGRLADALMFYDFSTAEKFVGRGWNPQKIHVAPNSLDQDNIQKMRKWWLSQPEQLSQFQEEKGLLGRKNILCIGRIYEENRFDLLIKALPAIKSVHPDVQLLIIGRINKTAEGLKDLAEGLGVGDMIRWLGPIYEEQEIAPYMLSSMFSCYPANVGLSIMHAMGYGLPVLTGNYILGHNPEIYVMRTHRNGYLFKHLDESDLAGKISNLLSQPEKLSAAGDVARSLMLQSYTTDAMAQGFMKAVGVCDHRHDASVTGAPYSLGERESPLISVVIPTYKRLDLLKRAVQSVFDQTYENWELVISDNEEPAGETWKYLTELSSKSPRVRVFQNNGKTGPITNVNNTLRHVRGEWVKPLFDDDELIPNCLEFFLDAVSNHPNVVLAGCLAYQVRPNKKDRVGRRATRHGIEIVEQQYAHLAMYLQDFECGGVPTQMFIRTSAIDAGAVMPGPPIIPSFITYSLDSYWYAAILQHGDRLHLGLPLVKEYQGHGTLTSSLEDNVQEKELVQYRRDLYNYIPEEQNPPSVKVVEQMIYGIRGLHKIFISGKIWIGVKELSRVHSPYAWCLVYKWILRRTFCGFFTATPRLRYQSPRFQRGEGNA